MQGLQHEKYVGLHHVLYAVNKKILISVRHKQMNTSVEHWIMFDLLIYVTFYSAVSILKYRQW